MASLDIRIRGDQLEQHRKQLERNLFDSDLSPHLSYVPGDDSDLEYPRHNSAPSPFLGFASFDHVSRDNLQSEEQSPHHAWSYRTADDEDGVNPYAGETISTAAHHASALTLSAGLGARPGRRDVSLSGAEYDPDRPLHGIMAGITSRLTVLDIDSTKSRQITSNTVDFDPLVVDDTAELDRVLQSGYSSAPITALRSPASPDTSASTSKPDDSGVSARPKLADALQRTAFSPKRPRSGQSNVSARSMQARSASLSQPQAKKGALARGANALPRSSEVINVTPKARNRSSQSLSYGGTHRSLSYAPAEPELHVQPPTPSRAHNDSKFTKLARNLTREIEREQNRDEGPSKTRASDLPLGAMQDRKASRSFTERSTPRNSKVAGNRTPFRNKVSLPDVTGLTSAVASPARLNIEYRQYEGEHLADARVLATLSVVQSKLAYLESENSISRRRVRELELELEECKKEVTRERTKVIERDHTINQRHVATSPIASGSGKLWGMGGRAGKKSNHTRGFSMDAEEDDLGKSRYEEVIEEKKALEALIFTLRSHLTRLTEELSDHKKLLVELRELRDSDVSALNEKGREVDKLRQEVERLAGEVEVLRGVIEEGLKERRDVRDEMPPEPSDDQSQQDASVRDIRQAAASSRSSSADTDSVVSSPSGGRSGTPSPHRPHLADKTARTDFATLGSSPLTMGAMVSQPFIEPEEMDRISAEVEERRSERSASASIRPDLESQGHSGSHTHSALSLQLGSPISPAPSLAARSARSASGRSEIGGERVAAVLPMRSSRCSTPVAGPSSHNSDVCETDCEPRDPKGSRGAPAGSRRPASQSIPEEPPFPRIRGGHMERLFFSVPEHNAQTCTTCHRRKRRRHSPSALDRRETQAFEPKRASREHGSDDEGFAEGSDDAHIRMPRAKGKGREQNPKPLQETRLPPQTVLSKVLRELEDDFAHYKSIYVELADQYKDIDAVSNVAKRNVLAEHLREVIDILEQKGDQIASLYDLLTFQDKPLKSSGAPSRKKSST